MKPGPAVLVTVTFKETACAVPAMPHWPVRVKFLGIDPGSDGGPYAPVNPLPRVSAIRQGVMAIKGSGEVGNASRPSLLRLAGVFPSSAAICVCAGLQSSGAGQFSIAVASEPALVSGRS